MAVAHQGAGTMAEAFGGNGAPIDFNKYIAGEEALQIAARSLRSLSKDVTALSKTITDDSGRISAGFAAIKQGFADIQGKVKLSFVDPADIKLIASLQQQLNELKKQEAEYKATQAAQATIQRGLSDVTKQYTSELAKQKDALRAAALAQDVEGQKKAAVAIRQTTQESQQLSKALRGANSEFTAAKGSYDALVIENNKLLASLHGLEGGLQAGSQEAQKLKKQIYDNTETLKLFDQETNRSFRNVGNYAQSFSGLIAELAKARTAQTSYSEGSADAARNQMRVSGFMREAQRQAAQMGLSYEQAEAKINGVTQAIQPLTTNLLRLEREQAQVAKTTGEESEAFQVLGFQIERTKKEINDVAAATVAVGNGQGKLAEQLGFSKAGLEQYAIGLAAGAVGLQAIVQGVQAVFQANVEYSRNLAEVRKTTGLTADEADRLGQSLLALDSPTNIAGLLKIASIGGQLGIAKGDLLEFTKAIDTAVQALGNDFAGGAEEIATTLGKITTVFRKELGPDVAQNILAVGSAVNQLGAEGAATAPFLTDVALRTGAVASQAGIGLKNVLAYAAVLQETGSTAEVAGTALNRLFSTLSTKTEESFKIAQRASPSLTLKEFTRLVNTDFNAAIQLFLKGLNSGNASTTEVSNRLKTLKLQSGEAKNAIITLAGNTELFAERQKTANDQLREGTSLAKEAAVNNDTLGGSYDKLKNSISTFFVSGAGAGILKFLVDIARIDLRLFAAPFREVANGVVFLGEKLGLIQKPATDYTKSLTDTALASRKLGASNQELINSYILLQDTSSRTAAQELDLQQTRSKLIKEFGTADVAVIQARIDKQTELAGAQASNFRFEIKQYDEYIQKLRGRAAAAAKIVNDAPRNSEGLPASLEGQQAAKDLGAAEKDLAEQQRLRGLAVAALARLEGVNTQAKKDGADAAIAEAKAEMDLGRAQRQRSKNRIDDLKGELEDNQTRLADLRKYQAEQAKLFADKQIASEVFAESVRGSEDLATQYERNGTAIRIKIARAETAEKLEEVEKSRIQQSKKKDITQEELSDIEREASLKRVNINKAEIREIEKIRKDAQQRQGAVDPLEFKTPTINLDVLRANLKEYVKTYEGELEKIKNAESAQESALIGALSRREITASQFDIRQRENRKRANDAILALDKQFHRATLDDQKKANQDALDDQNAAIAKRIATIEKIGAYTQEVEQGFFAIKGNFIDADIQRTQEAYDNEIKAAGENSALKLQIQNKYDKQLKKLNYDKAKAERDQAAISVAISTAVGIAKAFAEYVFPYALIPAGIALAQGALQEAVILSKPLPSYFIGRKDGPAELANVSEQGPEIIHRKASGRFEYIAEKSIVPLGQGDAVFTAHETSAMLASVGLTHQQAQQPQQMAAAFGGAAQQARIAREAASRNGADEMVRGMRSLEASISKLKQVNVNVHRGSDAEVQTSQSLTHYLSQRRFGR